MILASMKRRTLGRWVALAGAILIASFALAARGGNDSGTGAASAERHGTDGQPGAAFNNVDIMFVRMMISRHLPAMEMATLAQTRAADPRVKQLAARIRAEQTSQIATMKTLLTVWGQPIVTPSAAVPSGMPRLPGMLSSDDTARLKVATGKDLDKQFLRTMIAHHKGANQIARLEQATGSDPNAKALAGRIINDQQAEIAAMQKMLTER
jgi:uncharacterized protein (DUF305 family)